MFSLADAIKDALAPTKAELLRRTTIDATSGKSEPPAELTFSATSGVAHDVYGHFLVDGAFVFYLTSREWPRDGVSPRVRWRRGPFLAQFAALFVGDSVQDVIDELDPEHQAEGSPPVAVMHLNGIGAGFVNIESLAVELHDFRSFGFERLLGTSSPPQPSSLVLIVRRAVNGSGSMGHGAARRFLANEDEVAEAAEAAAAKAGLAFVRTSLEDIPLAEQVGVFASARVLVAQHGSGLANVVWMQEGSTVIELGAPAKSNCFESLSKVSAGTWLQCDFPGPWTGPLTVTIPELQARLDDACPS